MISKQTFDDIQKALVAVGKPRKKRGDKGLAFLNFATCGSCGYCITGERHIKKSGLRFGYYRRTHKNRSQICDDRSFIREEKLAEEVKRNTELASISEEWKERFLARIETWEADETQTNQVQVDRIKSELAILKAKIDRINNAFAEGAMELQEFKEIKNPITAKKTELDQKVAALTGRRTNRLEPLKNWVLQANTDEKSAFSENWVEMKSFLQKVGSNRLLRAQTLTVSFKKPWGLLAETNIALRSVSDVSERNSRWWSRQESNLRPSHCERDALPTELRPQPV
jgi:hypothetical protein